MLKRLPTARIIAAVAAAVVSTTGLFQIEGTSIVYSSWSESTSVTFRVNYKLYRGPNCFKMFDRNDGAMEEQLTAAGCRDAHTHI